MIYKIITNLSPQPPRAVRGSKTYMACRPVAPDALPFNRPPGVAGAWLLLQGSRRVSLEAGRARVRRKERTAQAAPRESPGGSPGEQEGTHSPPHTAVKESQSSSSSACTQSLRFMLQLGPRQPCKSWRVGREAGHPDAKKGASRGWRVWARSSRGSRTAGG